MFQYSGWADDSKVPSGSGLITLIAKVEKWQQHSGNGPITVICRSVVAYTFFSFVQKATAPARILY